MGPVGPEPGHDGLLGLELERLGVDEQAVHAEQHRAADRTLLGENDVIASLVNMAPRLVELR